MLDCGAGRGARAARGELTMSAEASAIAAARNVFVRLRFIVALTSPSSLAPISIATSDPISAHRAALARPPQPLFLESAPATRLLPRLRRCGPEPLSTALSIAYLRAQVAQLRETNARRQQYLQQDNSQAQH